MKRRHILALAALCVAGSQAAHAEPSALKQTILPYDLASGELRNDAGAEKALYGEIVDGGNVPWIRLSFGRVDLTPGSRIVLTSIEDGARQTHTAATLAQWKNTSAYFNGPRVRIEVVAAAGDGASVVEVDKIMVGVWEDATRSQCGPTDDRVPSNEPLRARLLNIGCSASIYTEDSCFITAGHCMSSPSFVNIVEFNVPSSLPSGTIQHPPPEDQYAVTNDRDYVNGGTGNDWGLFKVFPNSETGLMPFEAQGGALSLADTLPGPGDTIRVVGYGVDSGSANQTQQVSSGPMVGVSGNRLDYQTDTEGGNSGSAVTLPGTDEIVGIHTHGGCSVSGGGANSGTAITHPALQSAISTFCGDTGGGVTCADVDRMFARCNAASTVQVLVRMTDNTNLGETVTIAIDGNPQDVVVSAGGGQFAFSANPGFPSGPHTVSLENPAGCAIADVQVNCP